jgi:ABC-type uncharacterized transport system substrate-binding protein
MKRRAFITLLGGAAAWPLAARAQQPAMPVIAFMSARSPEDSTHLVEAFRRGLGEGGFVEGRNVTIEFRWARGDYSRLPALAADLVSRQVAVIVAAGGEPSGLAAKAATATIPIVFGIGGDPVALGLVESFSRPGGNATGVTLLTNLMEPKRLGLLRELAPGVPLIGVLLNPKFAPASRQLRQVEEAARGPGLLRKTGAYQLAGMETRADASINASWSPMPAATRNLRLHSRRSRVSASVQCLSRQTLTSTRGASKSLLLRHGSACPPFISFASML